MRIAPLAGEGPIALIHRPEKGGIQVQHQILQIETFSVIGKEGSTREGPGFVGRLWQEANAGFPEIAPLVAQDDAGQPLGFWGLMTDFSRTFLPWQEQYTQGLYLAGAQVRPDSIAPPGWTKWTAPASEYLRVKIQGDPGEAFSEAITWMQKKDLPLVGAVYDFLNPDENGQLYMLFPTRRL